MQAPVVRVEHRRTRVCSSSCSRVHAAHWGAVVRASSIPRRRAFSRTLACEAVAFWPSSSSNKPASIINDVKTSEAPQPTPIEAGTPTISSKRPLTVSWAGAGLYFFWQLGAMKFLASQYDLTKVPMVGASGGALAAVLAACGVDADRVLDHAYQLSLKHNIWERPLGLMGVWGSLIEKWLDELLPDNAHELCRGRVTIVVTTLPDMAQVGITDFKSKHDLINACMASSHIPFLLDWSPTRKCRGKRCVDGSFPDFFSGENCELLRGAAPGMGDAHVVFDYWYDAALNRQGRMDMLKLQSYEEIRRRYSVGYEYAAKLHADGRFNHFDLAELSLVGDRGHMSEVLVPEQNAGGPAAEEAAVAAAAAAGQGVAVCSSEQPGVRSGLLVELEQQTESDEGEGGTLPPRSPRRPPGGGSYRSPGQQPTPQHA